MRRQNLTKWNLEMETLVNLLWPYQTTPMSILEAFNQLPSQDLKLLTDAVEELIHQTKSRSYEAGCRASSLTW